jgi:hypothetical protein
MWEYSHISEYSHIWKCFRISEYSDIWEYFHIWEYSHRWEYSHMLEFHSKAIGARPFGQWERPPRGVTSSEGWPDARRSSNDLAGSRAWVVKAATRRPNRYTMRKPSAPMCGGRASSSASGGEHGRAAQRKKLDFA